MTLAAARPAGPIRVSAARRQVMTPLDPARTVRRAMWRAPVSDPGGAEVATVVEAHSADGVWRYARQDDGIGTLWTVTHMPTGQYREGYATLAGARRDTARVPGLLGDLRGEAVLAMRADTETVRTAGQRWIGVHLRLVGAFDGVDVAARCECGGLLHPTSAAGDLGHVDGCDTCNLDGITGRRTCVYADDHQFCGTPRPVECIHDGCGELARPNGGRGCPRAAGDDCCGVCCHGEA